MVRTVRAGAGENDGCAKVWRVGGTSCRDGFAHNDWRRGRSAAGLRKDVAAH